MKAMILAAGLGTRLRPLTNDLPKALLPVSGRPLIQYTLLLLKKYGITNIVINLHHHGQKIMDELEDGGKLGLNISYSFEPEILGTGGGLKKVWHLLSDETFFVINSDILVDLNLDKVVEFHRRRKAVATLVLREDKNADDWGVLQIDSQDRIRQIRDQPACDEAGLIKRMFTGIHVLEPQIFRYMPSSGFFNIMDVYLDMLRRNEHIAGYTMKGYWIDLGTPERYRKAQEDIQRGGVKLNYLKKN
jgi:NDP-sugar pyrophosphorylase family protein